tara:strand:- start:3160 stop:3363 length:204 start_codon:yes stop_codon:yes gene_type:complete
MNLMEEQLRLSVWLGSEVRAIQVTLSQFLVYMSMEVQLLETYGLKLVELNERENENEDSQNMLSKRS